MDMQIHNPKTNKKITGSCSRDPFLPRKSSHVQLKASRTEHTSQHRWERGCPPPMQMVVERRQGSNRTMSLPLRKRKAPPTGVPPNLKVLAARALFNEEDEQGQQATCLPCGWGRETWGGYTSNAAVAVPGGLYRGLGL